MRFAQTCLVSLALLASSTAFAAHKTAGVSHDVEMTIKKMFSTFDAAWAKGDGVGRASIFSSNASVINPFGQVANGMGEITKLFNDEMAGPLKGTMHTATVTSITMLAPTVAMIDCDLKLTGMRNADGKPTADLNMHGVFVATKMDGKWMMTVARPYAFLPMPRGTTGTN